MNIKETGDEGRPPRSSSQLPLPGGKTLDPDSAKPKGIPVAPRDPSVIGGEKQTVEDVRRHVENALRLTNDVADSKPTKDGSNETSSHDPLSLIEPARDSIDHGRELLAEWDADAAVGRQPSKSQAELTQILHDHVDQLDLRLAELQNQVTSGKVPSSNLLGQICDGIIRVTVITVIGGLLGGPILAFATQGPIGEKILEMTLASLIASTSTEAAATVASKQDYNSSRPSVDIAERYGLYDHKEGDSAEDDIQRRYFGDEPPVPEKSWRPPPPHL